MGQPYVGEIRMFAGNFPPNGWMFCEGQTLPISENEVLFQLIGTTYGGDGQETFNLPNLASRLPVWVSVALAVFFELFTLWAIRDNLTLNVLMLLHPFPAIEAWQSGA